MLKLKKDKEGTHQKENNYNIIFNIIYKQNTRFKNLISSNGFSFKKSVGGFLIIALLFVLLMSPYYANDSLGSEKFTFLGDNNNNLTDINENSSSNATITVTPMVSYVHNTTIKIKLTDGNTAPIPNAVVNLTLTNKTKIPIELDANGEAEVQMNDTNINEETIMVEYGDNLSKREELNIQKRPISINCSSSDDEKVNLITIIDTVSNSSVTNKNIKIIFENNSELNLTTDESGICTTDLSNVNGKIQVISPEDDVYEQASSEFQASAKKEEIETKTTAQVLNDTVNHVEIEITVTDINDNPVTGGTVSITNQNGEKISEDISLQDGKANAMLSIDKTGTCELTINYNPSEGYKNSKYILTFNVQSEEIDNYISDVSSNNDNTTTTSEDSYNSFASSDSSSSSGSSYGSYIANSNTGKFHSSGCSEVSRMVEGNKVPLDSREEAITRGYVPCKKCNP